MYSACSRRIKSTQNVQKCALSCSGLADNCNEFAALVRTGDLDFFLLRPVDEQFLVSCRKIDWSCAPNVLLGAGVMGYALWALRWHGPWRPPAG